ncbi:MAG: NAD(P)H-dependent oxidoreductase subunit E [Actinomycetota bacterium]|nr:NAD(P)H-dependent oxidoreductase subunit E [Actinomycetota bacterium]
MALSPDARREAGRIVARYPEPRSALLPLLYLVQAEQGYVTREGMQEVAEILSLTTAEVEAVATYYTMFKKGPTGKWLISVCTNLSCALAGGRKLYERALEALGPGAATSTEDGAFTVEEVECLAACDAAPVVQINYCNYDRVGEEQLLQMLEQLRNDDVPSPSRGPAPVPHADTARVLMGMGRPGRDVAAPRTEEPAGG